MNKYLREPLAQALLLLVLSYLLVEYGIVYLPPLVGVASAPLPDSVVLQFMITITVGILLWVSADEERWTRFKAPIHRSTVDPDRRALRRVLLVVVPLFVAFVTYLQVRPSASAPVRLRSVHPAPPGQINFRGETLRLAGLENPLRARGSLDDHVEEGRRVYYQNCLPCHGDRLDGRGPYASAFSPAPLSFVDGGTIAQLTESFVFWRIAKGGPGLPSEGAPWDSSMPAWENLLTAEEIWAVIIFLYEQSGHQPRTWETVADGEGS